MPEAERNRLTRDWHTSRYSKAMKEMTMNSERTSRNTCPVCCHPLRIQAIDTASTGILLWCASPLCKYGDISVDHAASQYAFNGVQAATEAEAAKIMEDAVAKFPERMAPDTQDEDAGSDR